MKPCRSRVIYREKRFWGRGRGLVRGFTMVELLVAIAIVGVLAAVLVGAFGPARQGARRATCDSRVKALSIALDAFRQERQRYPRSLSELVSAKIISDNQMLRCPDDPGLASAGYDAFYVLRGARNDPRFTRLPVVGQLPTLVCPFHEENAVGVQGFIGMQTYQFPTRAAVLVSASGATVRRASELSVTPAQAGLPLHGGDIIETGNGGAALIQFFDGSRCELSSGTKITVLQSFLQHGNGSLYTLVRQTMGDVAYSVTHNSKFDVSTPTSTAGALGTEFKISITGQPNSASYSEWWINSSPQPTSQVFWSTPRHTTIIPYQQWVNVGRESLAQTPTTSSGSNATPTPGPTPTPTDPNP